MKPHPTDDLCHWTITGAEAVALKNQMRKDYDLLAKIDSDALSRLLLNAKNAGSSDYHDGEAGAEL
jgi:hypothetical protein